MTEPNLTSVLHPVDGLDAVLTGYVAGLLHEAIHRQALIIAAEPILEGGRYLNAVRITTSSGPTYVMSIARLADV